ncbi:TetR/AcrR family transcriptional regulator [Nesterenkonia suensis]
MGRRGSYAKGLARRREILRTALEVVARSGYSSASVRELAGAVGLSQAGLLHHFGTKEELFIEVLRARDEVDVDRGAELEEGTADGGYGVQGFLEIIRHNAEVPGLVHLYTRMQAEAVDTSHAGHAFFRERQERVRRYLARAVRAEQEAGRMRADLEPESTARALMALADGLQAQWLYDPQVDMADVIARHLEALRV